MKIDKRAWNIGFVNKQVNRQQHGDKILSELEKKGQMVAQAIAFAKKAHEGQFRKGTRRPYIVHPMEVGEIVATLTSDEEIISAALLHDTIEDCKGITKELLAQEFTERVAALVAQESEDKSKTWVERKSHTIEHLKCASYEVRMIGLADKLSNIRDIDRDYPVMGEELWNRFRMKDKNTIGWYYKGVRESLRRGFEHEKAFQEYSYLVDKNFGIDGKISMVKLG